MQRGTRWAGAAVLVCALGLLGAAPAAAAAPDTGAAGATSAPAMTAKDWFEKGAAHHRLGEYEEAAKAYAEAYRLGGHPAYLYNLAVVTRLAGHDAEALRYYEQFVGADPTSTLRAEADKRIAELRASLRSDEAMRATPPLMPYDKGSRTGGGAGTSAVGAGDASGPRKSHVALYAGIGAGAGAVVVAGAVIAAVLLARPDPAVWAERRGLPVIDHR